MASSIRNMNVEAIAMVAQILPFPNAGGATISPIACFLRVGEAHKKLADLHAA
jgi:hypothetical protein